MRIASASLRLAPVVAAVLLAGCASPFGQLDERRNQASGPGELALDFIGPRFPNVVVELDAVDGAGPNAQALADFEKELEGALGKPVTIQTSKDVRGRGATHAYTLAEINDLELKYRSRYTDGDTAALYVLFLDGGFEAEGALGVAYHGSSVAMLKGTIRKNTQADDQIIPTPSTLGKPKERFVERAVLVHEFGHNLGLVNNGIPMVRPHEMTQDPVGETSDNEGEKHSKSDASVMFWAVDTFEVTNLFSSGEDIPSHFDADDKADIKNARSIER
ncbi:MAG TPA: hypothetical protein VI997_06555 [Candidatus Thermoplasmatota archaeon]|nr:hypothetical protein [Candidatus Thermoplasmatota archaeon]